MKPWARFAVTIVAGIALGLGAAVAGVKSRALGSDTRIGAWSTGKDFGSAQAGPLTRAVVAVKGLLALPASEARYYTATVDDAARPLDGRCSYRVTGGALPARWWSLTLYGADNFLVKNDADIFSVASMALSPAEAGGWTIAVAPDRTAGHWLPTGRAARFDLTLRSYLPADGGRGDLTATQLPKIERIAC